MFEQTSFMAVAIFLAFTGFTLGLSFWLGRRGQTASGYFAAHGQIGWFVNGIAFAGDYLSAASFLGICGMIAFYGYDGFLYSIGFLAGWVVALFVIAEPIKKLGKFTFADALDAKFGSRGIKLAAAVSTLVVSVFYLVPQMVGAGALIKPLLGLPHYAGVLIVGTVVVIIVLTAGMVSTTWVQFIKGSLLVVFCGMLTIAILARGLVVVPNVDTTTPVVVAAGSAPPKSGIIVAAPITPAGEPSLGPFQYIANLNGTQVLQYRKGEVKDGHTTFTPAVVSAGDLMAPGGSPMFKGVRSENWRDRLDFISLMLALFCGTASLPHILIRYYTVKDALSARKSTVVGIAAIGCFYVLTLYIGLGAMVSGNLNPADSNMAAPLLARTFGDFPFAVITAIAFTTVLGTVAGLILAASGAVAHDLMEHVVGHQLTDQAKVRAAKWSALVVGAVAMYLGIQFEKLNVSFLVGWAFNVAASANLPALIMLLFWKGTTRQGIIASVLVGLFSSLTWLLLSGPAMTGIYGLPATNAMVPFSQPGLVTIPLAFIVLIVVSLVTRRPASAAA
jgi:cation/acetate symporter